MLESADRKGRLHTSSDWMLHPNKHGCAQINRVLALSPMPLIRPANICDSILTGRLPRASSNRGDLPAFIFLHPISSKLHTSNMETIHEDFGSAPVPFFNPAPYGTSEPRPDQVFIMTRKFSTLGIPNQPDLIDVYSTVDKAMAAMRVGIAIYNHERSEAEKLRPMVYGNRQSGGCWAYVRYEDLQLTTTLTITIGAYGVDGAAVTGSGSVGQARAEATENV